MTRNPQLRITVLVENSAPPWLRAEHGLSLWLEYRGECCLLDAGQSGAFAQNADRLGIDLSRARLALLSHGHYDHAGGLAAFCERNAQAPICCRPEALGRCLHRAPGRPDREIGIPQTVLAACARRFRPVEGAAEVLPGLWLLPHTAPGLERRARQTGMYRTGPDGPVPDDFAHEQTVALELEEGLVLLNSCSHGGMDTVVREARAALPGRRILAVLGGFHLGIRRLEYSPEEVRALGRRLADLGVETVYTGHCTGEEGFSLLREALGERCRALTTGLELAFL